MPAIGRDMNNLYLRYDYLVSKSLHTKKIGVIKLWWSISAREQTQINSQGFKATLNRRILHVVVYVIQEFNTFLTAK